jgi:hypothetical protein
MTMEKPREIIVRPVEAGSTNPELKTMGLHVRDTQTGANMWLPTPIWRNGATVSGREAAKHAGELLLMAQAAHGTLSWDRDTADRTVFTVFTA